MGCRRAVVLIAVLAVLTAALLSAAAPAHAAVWVIPAAERAFPGTQPGKAQTVALDAAGGEYEGAQVVVRGAAARDVRLTWTEGSDALITANATLAQVAYVHVSRPSSGTGAKAGDYPDPLLPRAFGAAVRMPARTAAFYVLVHVPYGARPGTYSAALQVANGAEQVKVPVRLRVWDFGWKRLCTHSAFALSARGIETSLQGSVRFSGETKERILTAYYAMLLAHGVTPMPLHTLPKVAADGSIDAARYAADLQPWLGEDGLGFPDVQLPWFRWYPWSQASTPASSPRLATYLTQVSRVFKDNGWQSKAFGYVDRRAHRGQGRARRRGLRAGPAPRLGQGRLPLPLPAHRRAAPDLARRRQDRQLVPLRRRRHLVPALLLLLRARAGAARPQGRRRGDRWYTYANDSAGSNPGYLIEKPHADQRVFGWLMQQWGVDGLLNWGTNRWGNAATGSGWRDPYKDPLSYRKGSADGRAWNGEACLIYPGYYPRYGLDDPYAPPVSSLRLEALRDGLEEREYLRLASKTAGGAAFVKKVAAKVAWFPYPIRQGNVFTFPKYTTKPAVFDRARRQLAERIEGLQ